MGIGLAGAFGASNLADSLDNSLKDKIKEKLMAEAIDRQVAQQKFENDLKTKQFQSGEDLKNAQLSALTETRAAQEADRQNTGNIKLGDAIPAGTELPQSSPIAGRLVAVGQAIPKPSTAEAPPDALAAVSGMGDQPLAGTIANSPSPIVGRLVVKTPSQAQQTTQDAADARVEAARLAAENRTNDNEQKAKDRLAQIAAAAAAKPTVDKLTKVEHKDPTTGKTIIEWLPQSEIRGKTFDKGASGATETRLASAQAVNQTGDDIIAKMKDPQFAALVGPVMGRYNSLRDFIGNPPPEFSELAGQIESYAIANMGVHGMRSAQGAEKIKAMLNKKHTPESLASTIKGLSGFSQHFMDNEGRTGSSFDTSGKFTGNSTIGDQSKPSAADLIKKYGGM